uniref:Uncharacterized protein n=1 Tax=Timema cristinae TaxID=61476 RepID=A0A7R9HC00_TIMCR|nr:unnamed protein product [Timema cristinae]
MATVGKIEVSRDFHWSSSTCQDRGRYTPRIPEGKG